MLNPLSRQSRSKREEDAYPPGYVEDSSAARTRLGSVFSILLDLNLLLRYPHDLFGGRHAQGNLRRALLL